MSEASPSVLSFLPKEIKEEYKSLLFKLPRGSSKLFEEKVIVPSFYLKKIFDTSQTSDPKTLSRTEIEAHLLGFQYFAHFIKPSPQASGINDPAKATHIDFLLIALDKVRSIANSVFKFKALDPNEETKKLTELAKVDAKNLKESAKIFNDTSLSTVIESLNSFLNPKTETSNLTPRSKNAEELFNAEKSLSTLIRASARYLHDSVKGPTRVGMAKVVQSNMLEITSKPKRAATIKAIVSISIGAFFLLRMFLFISNPLTKQAIIAAVLGHLAVLPLVYGYEEAKKALEINKKEKFFSEFIFKTLA